MTMFTKIKAVPEMERLFWSYQKKRKRFFFFSYGSQETESNL